MRTHVLHKTLGETPLAAVERFRSVQNISKDTPIAYAGRLDPMATGKLLLLIGDECKKQKAYTGLDKEYVIEVLLGISTDTGDVLGVPSAGPSVTPLRTQIKDALTKEVGTYERAYPVFSSKTVNGVPLFLHALQGTLNTISIPTHQETIYAIRHIETAQISNLELQERVFENLDAAPVSDDPRKTLGADFRIRTIRPLWEELLAKDSIYSVLTLRVRSGSGAYMRTLAERIGRSLGTSALALSITRTRIGTYSRIGFFTKEYR